MDPAAEEPIDETPLDLPESASKPEDDYQTLKYSLLGPSLTKAGQDAVDQRKVSPLL